MKEEAITNALAVCSPRQREAMVMLLSGAGAREVAQRMGVTECRVNQYRGAFHKKLEVAWRKIKFESMRDAFGVAKKKPTRLGSAEATGSRL